jgi:hypothetical protein
VIEDKEEGNLFNNSKENKCQYPPRLDSPTFDSETTIKGGVDPGSKKAENNGNFIQKNINYV